MTCANCHSPKGPPAGRRRQGLFGRTSLQRAALRCHRRRTSRPTRRPASATGATPRSRRRSSTGKRPNGVPLAEIMPTAFYPILTDGDANALVAYLQEPAAGEEQGAGPGLQDRAAASRLPRRRKGLSRRPTLNDKVKKRLLPRHHRPLHGVPHAVRASGGGIDVANSLGKGGREFPGPWGVSKSRNITSSRDRGHRRLDRRRDQDARSRRARAATAARSRGRWATSTTPR